VPLWEKCQGKWLDHPLPQLDGSEETIRGNCNAYAEQRHNTCLDACMTDRAVSGFWCSAELVEPIFDDEVTVKKGTLERSGLCCDTNRVHCYDGTQSGEVSCLFSDSL